MLNKCLYTLCYSCSRAQENKQTLKTQIKKWLQSTRGLHQHEFRSSFRVNSKTLCLSSLIKSTASNTYSWLEFYVNFLHVSSSQKIKIKNINIRTRAEKKSAIGLVTNYSYDPVHDWLQISFACIVTHDSYNCSDKIIKHCIKPRCRGSHFF